MKKFLAVFTGSVTSSSQTTWQALDEATRQKRMAEGMAAWGAWMGKHQASIVVEGGPLGKTKLVSPAGIADIRNNMSGFVVVSADSHEAATRMFEGHPHFTIFPGDGVEIMECIPIPGR
jgi:hypothetical protein